ncbi:hypothetical protein [uncultured Flavobacterium sp.]|uniref:hypothetical protein n=1 Tax=uncultured Flavobacterium sp. TaxID=165435 RepID=UPI0030ED4F64|tara:strand:+ start:41807 stop:44080 length:2274 start_codon:yes stop_codon:yes gene_type:complete
MSNVNQGYNDRVRYIIQNIDLGSEIITEPIGWNSDEKELERHKDYHGIFPKFSNSLKFIGTAYDYLKLADELYGVNVDVRLVKEEKHPKTDEWTRTYDGYLDFSTISDEDNQISLKFNSGGIEAELKSRESEDVELTRLTTMDGDTLLPLSLNQVEIDGRRIFLQSIWNTDANNNEVELDVKSDDGNTRRLTKAFPINLINKSHEEASSAIFGSEGNENVGSAGMMIIRQSDVIRNLVIKGNAIKFKPVIISPYPGNGVLNEIDWGIISVCLTVFKDGGDYNVKSRDYLFSSQTLGGNTYNQLMQADGVLRELNFIKNITLLPGESIALELFIESDLKNFPTVTAHFTVNFKELSGGLTIEEDSFFDKTISNMVLPFEAAERLIQIYTNKKVLKSNALGRTDIGYLEDGKSSLIGLLHGFWIRGFSSVDEVFKPLTTNLKEFMESFSTTQNLGLGIESNGFKEYVRIEDLSYFYNKNVTIKLPNQVKKVKRYTSTDYSYSAIEIGYEKGATYEEAFGLVEYNGTSKFSTVIKKLKNIYSKISKYRADSYGIEFARRKQKLTHATTDTNYDTDVFNIDLKRSITGLFKLRKWQDDFEQLPTGTFSPETAYNLRLSPFNCLLRHGWVIASGFTKYLSDFVRYTSSTANSNLSTKLRTDSQYLLDPLHSVANGNEYAENGNIVNSELKRARYLSKIIEFEHEVDFDVSQMIHGRTIVLGNEIPNIYGRVEFINEDGDPEKGFLLSVKPNGNGQFKILKSN